MIYKSNLERDDAISTFAEVVRSGAHAAAMAGGNEIARGALSGICGPATRQCLLWKLIEMALADAGNKCWVTSACGVTFSTVSHGKLVALAWVLGKSAELRDGDLGHCLPYRMHFGGIPAVCDGRVPLR